MVPVDATPEGAMGLPADPAQDAREARADARLVLYVARARLRLGPPPFDLAARLVAGAGDGRLSLRTRRLAAGLLGRLRLAALAMDPNGLAGAPTSARDGRES